MTWQDFTCLGWSLLLQCRYGCKGEKTEQWLWESISKMAVEKKKEMKVLVTQSCPTLCDRMDCSPPDLCPWNSPGKKTGVGRCSLLQGIFPTPGSNMGLLHCRQFLYWLSHQGSPLSLISSRFIYTGTCDRISLLFKAEQYSIVWIYHILLICNWWTFGLFLLLSTMNNAAMDIHI